ncbi:type II secretion system protein J [Sporichthya sp.]|uniref:PulJ/GspJ family protein n=1 Tax=Sporichthya sp. TaxID=65475 RepID=UPI00178F8CB4|nr:prepilin-type N-terminal cleavage/methylation domain-containing protein [Sporichthya sp.]MBA3742091.1 prepilin-type N-terminal cleavage/methylation domain-containing protein [Sporichthya sp.]
MRRPTRRGPADAGFSLIELLVGMTLLSVLAGTLLSMVLSLQKSTTDVTRNADLLHETQLAMERLVRELRQAGTIDAVELPTSPTAPTAITFFADFDNDGLRDLDASDPEVLSYRFVPSTRQLTLTIDDAAGNAITTPILATNVSGFGLELHSSLWQYDRSVPRDGVVTWAELDATPGVGNQNGIPDAPELTRIDSVVVTVSVADGARNQSYRTQVDFRNRNLS